MVFGLVGPVLLSVQSAGAVITGPSADRAHSMAVARNSKAAPCTPAVDETNPYPYSKDLTATIDGIAPTVVSSTSGNLLTVTGTITNSTTGPIYDLRYVFERGEVLSTLPAIKAEIASPGRPDAVVGQNWKILGPTATSSTEISMSAGTSVRFVATVPISSADGLIIATRGVYPLMIKVSGDVGTNGCVQYERVGEFHLLATVLSVPPAVETTPPGPASVTGPGAVGSGGSGSGAPGSTSSGSTASGSTLAGSTGSGVPSSSTDGQGPSAVISTDIPTQGFPTTAVSLQPPATSGAPVSGQVPGPSSATPTTTASSPASSTTTTPPTTTPPTTTPATSAPPSPPSPAGADVNSGKHPATALNLIWPIVDAPHVGLGGVFLDDELAAEISAGGRLEKVLSALTQIDAGPSSTTVVVDPELLAEIEQMAGGYRVQSVKGVAQSALIATTPTPTPGTGPPTVSGPATVSGPVTAAGVGTNVGSTAVGSTAVGSTPVGSVGNAAPSRTIVAPATTTPAATPAPTPAKTSHRVGRSSGPGTRVAAPRTPAKTAATSVLPSTRAATATPTTGPGAHPRPIPTAGSTPSAPSTAPTTPAALAPRDPTVAGVGQAAAITYLAALRKAVAGRQVLVLPFSDPDAVAMVRAGLGQQLSSLVSRGRDVASRVLQLAPITAPGQPGLVTTMAMPEGGVVDDATLAALSNNGLTQALLSPRSLQHAGGAIGAVTIDEARNGGHAVNAVVTDADVLSMVNTVVGKGRSAGLAVRLDALAAVLAGGNFDGSATPLILTQSHRWTPDVAGLQVLTGLLRAMESGGVLAGVPLPAIAGVAKLASTVTYPDDARQHELDADYLASVGRDLGLLAGVRDSVAKTKGTLTLDPADVLDPLSTAMALTMSTGFRTNDRTGRSILQTTEATLRPLHEGVKIAAGTSYTLAASTSPLLINVRNDLPYVVTVRVVIRGAQTVGMTATDPGPLSIPAGQARQFKIETKVVKAGKFPIQVQLIAADGSAWSDPQTITVRSSAYGTLTVILIIVAGGALFLMVALRIVQRIRARNKDDGDAGRRDREPGDHQDLHPHDGHRDEAADVLEVRNPNRSQTSSDDAVDRRRAPGLGATGQGAPGLGAPRQGDDSDSDDGMDDAGGGDKR
ncbi:DUF6049 family protein [Nakamurella sp. PAMC28650]|uniref:DUF6049 family protein n=1 Tax=Nakamurella sp. PAMC28650 TaxID=2762325 RepID=UPI00164EAEB5|nr:DUF6049 family protein [Nakamurella sp. PAMC28650]QNK82201.1 hypothetical protein H7F38_05485 [Nakamurella sp. PAMC28650]